MSQKIRVGLLFGGRSAEHEVSLQSAKNVADALDKDKYDLVLIGIDKDGKWHLNDASNYLLHADNPRLIKLNASQTDVALLPGDNDKQLMQIDKGDAIGQIDVIFSVLHGTNGEDGTMQGLLRLANVPFVGPDVLGSSVAMDKDVTKRLLRDAGIPVSPWITVMRHQRHRINFAEVKDTLGLPCFVKPANAGSSVGVHKVTDEASFEAALDDAFQYDTKLLIEEGIVGREIECAVLGNEDPQASILGEVIPQNDFYSYQAKYIDEKGALLEMPAKLTDEQVKQAQAIAIQTFQVLCLEGMSRVDFFLRGEDEWMINEVNTLPGFTKISMYPKLWELSGLPYGQLLDRLIQLAIERFERDNALKTQVEL